MLVLNLFEFFSVFVVTFNAWMCFHTGGCFIAQLTLTSFHVFTRNKLLLLLLQYISIFNSELI